MAPASAKKSPRRNRPKIAALNLQVTQARKIFAAARDRALKFKTALKQARKTHKLAKRAAKDARKELKALKRALNAATLAVIAPREPKDGATKTTATSVPSPLRLRRSPAKQQRKVPAGAAAAPELTDSPITAPAVAPVAEPPAASTEHDADAAVAGDPLPAPVVGSA